MARGTRVAKRIGRNAVRQDVLMITSDRERIRAVYGAMPLFGSRVGMAEADLNAMS
jgi:hypothetical protein